MGKNESEAEAEVQKTLKHIDFYVNNAETFFKSNDIREHHRMVYRTFLKPVGVILKISPFNFPFWLGMKTGISNMLLGNSTIIKNSSECLLVSEVEEEIFNHKGINETLAVAYSDTKDTENLISMH